MKKKKLGENIIYLLISFYAYELNQVFLSGAKNYKWCVIIGKNKQKQTKTKKKPKHMELKTGLCLNSREVD